jgi:hypothetical protein
MLGWVSHVLGSAQTSATMGEGMCKAISNFSSPSCLKLCDIAKISAENCTDKVAVCQGLYEEFGCAALGISLVGSIERS